MMLKIKRKTVGLLSVLLLMVLMTGCSSDSSGEARTNTYDTLSAVDDQDVFYTPWPAVLKSTLQSEAGPAGSKKPYTLMLYVNGSDLESDGGAASADFREMLDAQFDPDKVNVVIYAGGTLAWDSSALDWVSDDPGTLPDSTSAIYTIVKDGSSNKLKTLNYDISESNNGTPLSMMDGGTLSGFIDYTKEQFPADKYSLIFWNHGSGSLIGYGYDELLDPEDPRTSMNLLTLQKGLTEGKTHFDFVGFDTCLMSNLETALAVKSTADTLVASQELEPGYGWDYAWLKDLSDAPTKDSQSLGKNIVDHFNAYYKENVTAIGSSLSVTDLGKTDTVMQALGNLAAACSSDLTAGDFPILANARDKTETFGSSDVKSDQYQYMTDMRDMAKELETRHPEEVQALNSALDQAVVYSKTTDFNSAKERENVGGLSVYYPYAYADDSEQYRFNTMRSLGISDNYVNYLNNYSDIFYGGSGNAQIEAPMQQVVASTPVQESPDGDVFVQLSTDELGTMQSISFNVWQAVDEPDMEDYYFAYLEEGGVEIDANGKITTEFGGVLAQLGNDYLCLYAIESTDDQTIYSSPALLNGVEVNLLISISDADPDGKILGAQPATNETSGVPSRDIKQIKKGDELILEYYAEYLGDDPEKEGMWYEGEPIKVGSQLNIEWVDVPINEVFMYGYCIEDVYHNIYYTDFIEIEFFE